jgi:hypothetical protein
MHIDVIAPNLFETFDIREAVMDEYDIMIIYTGENQTCHLQIGNLVADRVVLDEQYPNPKMLSAALASTIGMARLDCVTQWAFPEGSQMWHLNQHGAR